MIQPLLPLFNFDIPKTICNYPIMRRTFNIKIAYIETPNIIFVHPLAALDSLYQLLDEMYEYYENKGNFIFICPFSIFITS